MRRFITSLPGRAVAQLLSAALLLPYLTLALAGRAEAQLTQLPSWAVLEFENKTQNANLGQAAAEAVQNELAKTGRVDAVPQESIQRAMTDLGQTSPVALKHDQLRLGQELRASSIVTGSVLGARVVPTGSGKYGQVTIQVVVTDVASGHPINGALVTGTSTTRAGDVADDTLYEAALGSAASRAVDRINSQTLPTATVLNTRPGDALINQGSRGGFKDGQEVIVVRGNRQVASGRIFGTEADSSQIRIERQELGVQPGDKARVVFPVPQPILAAGGTIKWPDDPNEDTPQRKPKTTRGGGSGLTTLALVLGLAVVLFGGGRGSSQTAAVDVLAEALLYPDSSGEPAVKVSWSPDLFAKGVQNRVQWQVWRSDIIDTPVLVVPGSQISAVDTSQPRSVSYQLTPQGGTTCEDLSLEDADGIPGVTPGKPYTYQVQLLFRINSIDLPDGSSTGTGGTGTGGTGGSLTTGGTTATTGGGGNLTTGGTTTATTGGTTGGGTGGGSAEFCYFVSTRATSRGLATPLPRPDLINPAPNAVVAAPIFFSFTSVVNPAFPITVEYVVQISPQPTFPRGQTNTVAKFTRSDTGTLATGIVNTATMFPTANELWWRIGARNVADRPGPVPDASGERYIFSPPRRFTRPGLPPPPP